MIATAKFAKAGRLRQHARRVRSPELRRTYFAGTIFITTPLVPAGPGLAPPQM
jgi:hypothetical protein